MSLEHGFTSIPASDCPTSPAMTRRVVLTRAVLLPLAATLAGALSACSHEPSCNDTSGLSPDDAKIRTEIAAYVDPAQDQAKRCANCVQFVPGAANACGTCKVVKGPISPKGGCKLFVAKPA